MPDSIHKIIHHVQASTKWICGVLNSIFAYTRQIFESVMIIIDEHLIYAASLSFYTIFALIPTILVIFSILLNIPQFASQIEDLKFIVLSNIIPTNYDVFSSYIDIFLKNTEGLGIVGFIYIFVISILFFRNFENIATKVFNSQTRDFINSLMMYWTLITLMPIAISASFYFSFEVQQSLFKNYDLSFVYSLLPYIFTWFSFFILFRICANKRLSFSALLISSFLSALAWLFGKRIFIEYVFLNKIYKSIYGSISVLLFFIMWIYISWIIVLAGMRICELINKSLTKENKNLATL